MSGDAAWTALRVVGVLALVAAVIYAITRAEIVDSRQDADRALRDYRACVTSDESRAAIRQGFARLADANIAARAEAGADAATLARVRKSSDLFLAQLKDALPPRNCDPLLPGARAELAAISGATVRRARTQDDAVARRLARRDPLTAPIAARRMPDPGSTTRSPRPRVSLPAPRSPRSPAAPTLPAPASPAPAPPGASSPAPASPAPTPAPAPSPAPTDPPIVTLPALPGIPSIEVGPILGSPPLVGG